MTNNELYHYGVPGMKWGQRKAVSKVDKVSARSKKRGWSDDATEVAKIQTKRPSQMSNNELTKVNNRKSLEQNYSRLNPNVFKKGLLIAGSTAAALGTVAALYKNSKQVADIGKKISGNFVKKHSSPSASQRFWNDMKKLNNVRYNDIKDMLG